MQDKSREDLPEASICQISEPEATDIEIIYAAQGKLQSSVATGRAAVDVRVDLRSLWRKGGVGRALRAKAFGFLNRPANLGIASPAPLSSLAPVQTGTRDCRYLNQPARLGQAWRAGALVFSIFSPFRASNHQQHREDGYRVANT